ncbi:DinB family protein [Deinococcus sp. HMF7604]|uniref:DinB family protein n=1 Tax=Deinococcus betulae TaxID=2873312 RepID=UPI001CCCA49D|nr:DinB family protein [Deinococcus betulae]
MTRWEHLFYGEFADRRTLLAGLTLAQVTARPGRAPHSIYDELWHAALWQDIMVDRDEALYEGVWQTGERYPGRPPTDLAEWTALVDRFFSGLTRALAWTSSAEQLEQEVNPGETMADLLRALAVHNSYHLGKIVGLRQVMGAWPA